MKYIIKLIKALLIITICIVISIYLGNTRKPPITYKLHYPTLKDTVDDVTFIGKTAEEGLKEAIKFYDIKYPDIVYAQAVLETGHFKSKLCIENNNLFGLYDSKNKRYYSFNHWSESVKAYKDWIQYKYKHPEDYYSFLVRIKYASDPDYINKLKTIVKNDKRRYTARDTVN